MLNNRIPRWKKWLSHYTPLTLEETGSDQNPELTVRLDRGRIQLLSKNAVYSWDDLYHNFRIAFEQLDVQHRTVDDVLVLGLGLGSVPFLLEKNLGLRPHITAIEWDETIVELAERYTLSRLSIPVEVVIADAAVFVDVCEEQFDLIAVDLFDDQTTPEIFETVDFLEACAARLRPGGLLLFNRLYHTDQERISTERFYEHTFKQVFPDGDTIDTKGNWILWTSI